MEKSCSIRYVLTRPSVFQMPDRTLFVDFSYSWLLDTYLWNKFN